MKRNDRGHVADSLITEYAARRKCNTGNHFRYTKSTLLQTYTTEPKSTVESSFRRTFTSDFLHFRFGHILRHCARYKFTYYYYYRPLLSHRRIRVCLKNSHREELVWSDYIGLSFLMYIQLLYICNLLAVKVAAQAVG